MNIRFFTIPNIITLLNLFSGCLAIVYALGGDDLRVSFFLIIAAAVFDFFDGFMARLLGAYSPLGKQLDSLADVVSFGVAPSAILYAVCVASGASMYSSAVVFIVAAFSALRLAKFNIDDSQSDEFEGLPTPANALMLGSLGYLYAQGIVEIQPIYIIIMSVVMSFLLISPIRMFALKFHSYKFEANKLRYSFLVGAVVVLAILGIAAIPVVILSYIAISTIKHLVG